MEDWVGERNIWSTRRPDRIGERDLYRDHKKGAEEISVLRLVPKIIHIGVGCRGKVPGKEIKACVLEVLRRRNCVPESVAAVASIDRKRDEEGILKLAEYFHVPFHTFSARELSEVMGRFEESSFVAEVTGVGNVCERAALLGAGVCGLDLAGAEALYPTRDFEELFCKARKENIPFTIHAGEADGPDSIRAALSFGARRIGHGVRVTEDKALLEEVIRKQVTLEMCVTSNLQTKAVREGREHPALWLLRQGAAVTINTDDMTVCKTTISEELKWLRSMGMTREEERKLWENALKGAFLPEEEKEALGREVRLRL